MIYTALLAATVLVGVHANQDGLCTSTVATAACEDDLASVEAATLTPVGIDSQYAHENEFSSLGGLEIQADDIASGHVPMLTWFLGNGGGDCPLWSDIVAGVYDSDYIDKAHALATLGGNILIRMDPAMETVQRQCFYSVDMVADPAGAGQEFIAMWQHIVDLVRPLAPNIRWDWSPSSTAFKADAPLWQFYYPGNSYVDWIGSQIYNFNPFNRVAIQNSNAFTDFYAEMALFGKPLILSETGAIGPDPQDPCTYSNGLTSSAGQKWANSIAGNMSDYPAIQALVWFDAIGTGGDLGCLNYTLRGDAMTGFSNILSKRYFQKRMLP